MSNLHVLFSGTCTEFLYLFKTAKNVRLLYDKTIEPVQTIGVNLEQNMFVVFSLQLIIWDFLFYGFKLLIFFNILTCFD